MRLSSVMTRPRKRPAIPCLTIHRRPCRRSCRQVTVDLVAEEAPAVIILSKIRLQLLQNVAEIRLAHQRGSTKLILARRPAAGNPSLTRSLQHHASSTICLEERRTRRMEQHVALQKELSEMTPLLLKRRSNALLRPLRSHHHLPKTICWRTCFRRSLRPVAIHAETRRKRRPRMIRQRTASARAIC